MLRGFLTGPIARPILLRNADGGASGGAAGQPADPSPAATPEGGDPAPADPDPAPDPAPAADVDEEEEEPELSAAEWQAEAARRGRQAASYRTKLRSTEQQRDQLQARVAELEAVQASTPDRAAQDAEARIAAAERRALMVEVAAEAGVSTEALRAVRALNAASDEAGIREALTQLGQLIAPPSAGAHRPPQESGQPLSLAQQITDAEKAGDTRAAMRLKAQMHAPGR